MDKKKDILLDHDYDGIKELDNDLPPWWLWLFYISIGWSVLYMLYYHVLGIGPSSDQEYLAEMNPNMAVMAEASGSSLLPVYHSPYYSPKGEVTPKIVSQFEEYIGPNLTSDVLIVEAMRRGDDAQRDKLKSAFPDLWETVASGGAVLASRPAPAEEVVDDTPIEPLMDTASLENGKQVFVKNCVSCHGANGEGGIGPNMTDDYWIHGAGMNNVVHIIEKGVPAKGMISWRGVLNEDEIKQVASYILTLHGTDPPNQKKSQGEKVEYPL